MEDKLYIVLWTNKSRITWHHVPDGVYTSRRLAENMVECLKACGDTWEYGIVEGPITSPKQMAVQEVALGTF